MNYRSDHQKLLDYNIAVLEQGIKIIEAYAAAPGCDYSAHSGPHLRHIIEHYEAFTQHIAARSIDYDTRARDRILERDPAVARQRIENLQHQLAVLDAAAIVEPIAVRLCAGLNGEDTFVSFSSLTRELLFLASHAVHHYALVRVHCKAQGLDLGDDLGLAPSTLRHARQA